MSAWSEQRQRPAPPPASPQVGLDLRRPARPPAAAPLSIPVGAIHLVPVKGSILSVWVVVDNLSVLLAVPLWRWSLVIDRSRHQYPGLEVLLDGLNAECAHMLDAALAPRWAELVGGGDR